MVNTAFQTVPAVVGGCTRRVRTCSRRRAPVATVEAPMRARSVVALRGLSDAAWCAMMHEGAVRALVGCGAGVVGAEPQLMLGGLVGVWTAAALAARLRRERSAALSASVALPEDWACEDDVDETEDAAAVVAWLAALGEMENARAARLVWGLAKSGAPRVRAELAMALGAHPVRANVVDAALDALSRDPAPNVRYAALAAAAEQRELMGGPPVLDVDVTDVDDDRARLARLFAQTVEEEERPAETDVGDRVADALGGAALQTGVDAGIRLKVPLFDGLKWSELHVLCMVAVLPLAYDLLSLLGGADLPFRYVGLGWVLALGGLAAYPQSAKVWLGIEKACELDAEQYSEKE